MINEIAYLQLMSLNVEHGNSRVLGKVFKENYDYGKLLIDMFVESSKSESEE